MRDVLAREEQAQGLEARQRLQDTLVQTEQLDDVLAGLAFLRRAPRIDPARLASAGHSLGGQLTVLAAAREPTLRAAVSFAAAAGSWQRAAVLRQVLRDAVGRARCPILFVQWSNDFSTEPSLELGKLGDGLYLDMERWEPDVFRFLDDALSR